MQIVINIWNTLFRKRLINLCRPVPLPLVCFSRLSSSSEKPAQPRAICLDLPARPERPNLKTPIANTTTQAHPGSSPAAADQPISASSSGRKVPSPVQQDPALFEALSVSAGQTAWRNRGLADIHFPWPGCSFSLSPMLVGLSLQEVKGEIAMEINVEINRQWGSDYESVAEKGGQSCLLAPSNLLGRSTLRVGGGGFRCVACSGFFQNCAEIIPEVDSRMFRFRLLIIKNHFRGLGYNSGKGTRHVYTTFKRGRLEKSKEILTHPLFSVYLTNCSRFQEAWASVLRSERLFFFFFFNKWWLKMVISFFYFVTR